jgi:hypothetical protein
MHAGPGEETPGAQEMNEEYEFNYGFLVHSLEDPLNTSAEHVEVYHSQPTVIVLDHAEPPQNLFDPVVQLENSAVRISSMRMREDSILVTVYNSDNKKVETKVRLAEYIRSVCEVMIGDSVIQEHQLSGHSMKLAFNPREIKMCRLRKL